MIATLAQQLKNTAFINSIDLPRLLREDMFSWDCLVKQFPQAQTITRKVQVELNYELSISQCDNALNWVDKCDPSEWQYLLG